MRVVVVVFAALLTLGLAAFGVVAAQRANAPAAATAMSAQVAAPGQSARPPAARAPGAGPRAGRRYRSESDGGGGEADSGARRPRRSSDHPCPEHPRSGPSS